MNCSSKFKAKIAKNRQIAIISCFAMPQFTASFDLPRAGAKNGQNSVLQWHKNTSLQLPKIVQWSITNCVSEDAVTAL